MASLLADAPSAASSGQAPPDGSIASPGPSSPDSPPSTHAEVQRTCAKCGASMAAGQDWCLQCGAGAPGSLGSPAWRSATAVLGAVLVLVLGAAAAAYAALSKGSGKAHVLTTTVAQTTTPTATAPNPGAATTPTTPGALGIGGAKGATGLGTVKPPKIPLTAATPKASGTTGAGTNGTGASETTTSTQTTTTPAATTPSGTSTPSNRTSEAGEESQQAAILLDTNAASTYNPYGYPASEFGDPSLAIDGDTSTAWTAQVNPATAPKMAQGLLIDLKARQKVAVLQLVTSTPGMTVQVYGADGHTAPASITDPAWIPLSPPDVVKKRHLRVALRHSSKAFTFITLWISKAPASSVGTPQAPGHVSVNEVELFPTR